MFLSSSSSSDEASTPKRPKAIRVAEHVKPKDIFAAIFVEGWEDQCISKVDRASGETKDFFVAKCPKCTKSLLSNKKSNYTNPVDHVKRCMGTSAVTRAAKEHRKAATMSKDGKVAPTAQASILNAMCMANEQDIVLHRMAVLVTVFNLAIVLFKDPEFLMAILMEAADIDLFVDTLVWLTFIVEEKIAAEMKGKRGMIYHDGWTKFGVHYVCLFASYMVKCPGVELAKNSFKSVMTLITVSTLPHDEDDNATATAFNAKSHAKFFTTAFNNIGFNQVCEFATGQCGKTGIAMLCHTCLPSCPARLTP